MVEPGPAPELGHGQLLARKQAYRWANGENLPYTWSRPGMDLTSENYIDARLPVAREQLEKAGVRLALLLNEALDPGYTPPATPEPTAEAAAPANETASAGSPRRACPHAGKRGACFAGAVDAGGLLPDFICA